MSRLPIAIGETALLGTFVQIPHPIVSEVFGGLGFDFLCIEREHSAIDPTTLVELIRAADLAAVPSLVRVADNAYAAIAEVLDAGASGVLVPRVESADEAALVVSAARYPPLGKRGVGPGRASLYGRELGRYVANSATCVGIQIETKEAVSNLDRILEVDGIDLVFIGPTDLATSLGCPSSEDPKVVQVIDEVIGATLAAGRHVGIFATRTETALGWITKGCRVIVLASDLMFMTDGAAAAAATLRAGIRLHHG